MNVRKKGYTGEYNVVIALRKNGIDAKRVPLSGSTDFKKGDVVFAGMTGEVKVRKNGFKELYKWIEKVDVVFLKADRKDYLVVIRLDDFVKFLRRCKNGKEV